MLVARQQPTRADWDKVLSYTSRVRCLNEQPFGSESAVLPPDTADAMCEWIRPFSFLFPKLRKVCISLQHDRYYRFITTFITEPSLLHLELDGCYQPLLFQCAPNLASTCPSLVTLNITCEVYQIDDEDNGNNPIPAVLENLCGWRNLRNLSCGPLDCDALTYLSCLPTLRSLSIPATKYSSWINSPKRGYFDSLDHLTLLVDDFQVCMTAITMLFSLPDGRKAHLRSLRLQVDISQRGEALFSSPSQLASVTTALTAYLARTSLKEFFVSQESIPDAGMVPALTNLYTGLFPLTSFPALTHLTTRHYGNRSDDGYLLTESELLELLRHWPALERIDCATQSISLRSLVTILRLCSGVRFIMVPVKFSLNDVFECLFGAERPRGTPLTFADLPCHTSVTDLSFTFEPPDVVSPEAMLAVATFFFRVVPNIRAPFDRRLLEYVTRKQFWDATFAIVKSLRSGLWDSFLNRFVPPNPV
ncbi:hypothetical protein CONPUDRAFT_166093 [Coniophora puteana RWD-64-598 SS2]|uniref:F-box domain-containing protein n=1 Tax=Coniophora puteana (strain RWD-64-598) TaxID=741705 RepID=A0A5M3MPH0_CONPW|nr:uncharacterized protein CONPUDRAFT_166093 [Coniophora puteana RWD-64-598 SS2]EIW80614.1 hypothetical protein CONPUDRAFT_166093 [Coniophora puteana RWD-64-598 SS2]